MFFSPHPATTAHCKQLQMYCNRFRTAIAERLLQAATACLHLCTYIYALTGGNLLFNHNPLSAIMSAHVFVVVVAHFAQLLVLLN